MSYQLATPPAPGKRRAGLLFLGVIVLIAGVGVGAVLFITSGSRYDDAVKNLQRAPVGCDTRFNFTGTGDFIIYIETQGKIGKLSGNCTASNTSYTHKGEALPNPTLTLTAADGSPATGQLVLFSGASYDTAGFKGTAYRKLSLKSPAQYTLTVDDTSNDYAIAIGRNPKSDADAAKTIGIIVAAAGLVLGVLLILLGARRKTVPQTPTGQQPYGQQPYGQQPYGQQPPWQTGPTSPPGYQPQPSNPSTNHRRSISRRLRSTSRRHRSINRRSSRSLQPVPTLGVRHRRPSG